MMKLMFLTMLCLLVVGNASAMFFIYIGDYVWEDLNRDGIQDSNEPPIPGVLMSYELVTNDNRFFSGSQVTDLNGEYLLGWFGFRGIITITAVIPEGYTLTSPFQGDDVDLDSNFQILDNNIAVFTANLDDLYMKCGSYYLSVDLGLVRVQKEFSNCRTIGFWKTNIQKYLKSSDPKGVQVQYEDLIDWLVKLNYYYRDNPFNLGCSDEQILNNAYDILSYKGSNIKNKLLRQLLACELNLVSNTYTFKDVSYHDSLCKSAEDALNTVVNHSVLHRLHNEIDWLNNQSK